MIIPRPTSFDDITYPMSERPGKGELQAVASGVYWLAMPMSGSLAFINLYLLEDHNGWWIVDTGLSNKQTTDVWEDVFANALGDKPVVGVICTHMHPDHIGQAKHITDRFRCPLYMTHGEYFQARAFANGGGNSQSGWIGE